ncbi:uncharacterized protein BDZ99DRAFT_576075 [Mytilinidion resinicola]|uniref:F-box domain-containing protein n=1 Tax=Mytilinidion resinicola TaxID=574789 RepID=A0A6A6Y714_9PEZI|nr:uncharacterized protein BDZ99DRAFT_576075 [Mytilinidion resinicola]KAF2803597.1 hypothetical protein BDZ99DRAFT_576075 [Mytilinidion resinicola]
MARNAPHHWPLCEVHNLPKQKGVLTRAWKSMFSEKAISNPTSPAKILELPVELIVMIASYLPTSNAVCFALTSHYTYGCLENIVHESLEHPTSKPMIIAGATLMAATTPKNDFLFLLQKDHQDYWHHPSCQLLHYKPTAHPHPHPHNSSDLQISIGLRTPTLLLSIPFSSLLSIRQHHLNPRTGLCPSILNCHGTSTPHCSLTLTAHTSALISSCQLLWHGVFHLDWRIPRHLFADRTRFHLTPFLLCSHNTLVQNRLRLRLPSHRPQPEWGVYRAPPAPFIAATAPDGKEHSGDRYRPNMPPSAEICMCCPPQLFGCAYCDTDFLIEFTEELPNRRRYRIEVWKNFGNAHLGEDVFPRRDLGWRRGGRGKLEGEQEHWREVPGAVKRMWEERGRECGCEGGK